MGSGNTLNAFTADGFLKWWDVTDGQTVSSPAIGSDGIIYVGDNTGHLSATAPGGWGLWYVLANGPITSSPAIGADGVVYVGCGDGNLHAIGTQVNTVPVGAMSVNPTTVIGGARSTGYVTLSSPAPEGGDIITLLSGDPAVVVPPFVYVGSGLSAASFAINTNSVSQNTTAIITASSGGVNTTAALTVQVAGLTSVYIDPATVVGGQNSAGTVVLSSPAGPSGTAVALSSSDSKTATVPASVTIPAGRTSATFTINTASPGATQAVTISATINGDTATGTLTVNPANLTSVSIAPSSVVGGTNTSVGTVTLATAAPTGGAVINLSSASLSVKTPTSLTIPAGSTSANFSVTTLGVSATSLVTVTATYGSTLKTCVVTLLPAGISNLSVSPNSVVGGSNNTVTGTVSINGQAGPFGAVVTLTSSMPSAATVPAKVTIASGASSATFTINTLGVTAAKTVTITANLGGKTTTATLTVNPASLSSVSVDPSSVVGGTSSQGGLVTLNGAAPVGGIVVHLTSNGASASVPPIVSIPAGAISAAFTVTTQGVNSSTPVTVTAVAGSSTKTCSLTVLPADLVSLTVTPTATPGGISPNPIGTVTLNGKAGTGGRVVTLSSSNSELASVPSTVSVVAGKSSGTFVIKTSGVGSSTAVTISATLSGVTETATLTVNPPGIASITVSPASIVGGNNSTGGLVTLDSPAPAGGAFVALSSANQAVSVPASVTVPAGAKTAKFSITTSGVDAKTTVVLFGSLGPSLKTCTVTVLPATIMSVVISPNSVPSASTAAITGTVQLNGQAGPSGTVVALVSSNPLVAKVPSTMTVAPKASSGVFTVTHGTLTKVTTIKATVKAISAFTSFQVTP